MPLVVARDGTPLALAPRGRLVAGRSDEDRRALAPRLGLARDEEVKVSRVQCEVTPLGADGATLRVTSLGANPTPWFPAAHAHARRLIRKGEEATLRLGDGLGLFQDERAPGSMRVVAALTAAAAPSAAALATNPAAVVDLTRDGDDDAPLLPRDDAPAKTRDAAAAADPATALAKNPASPPAVRAAAAPSSSRSWSAPRRREEHVLRQAPDDPLARREPGHDRRERSPRLARAVPSRRPRALSLGLSVAVDRCHLTRDQRAPFADLARTRGATLVAVEMRVAASELVSRVRRRTNHAGGVEGEAGVKVVRRMLSGKANEAPSRGEGFERIVACRDDADAERALRSLDAIARGEERASLRVERRGEGVVEGIANEGIPSGVATDAARRREGVRGGGVVFPPEKKTKTRGDAFSEMMRAAKAKEKDEAEAKAKTSQTSPSPSAKRPTASAPPWARGLVDACARPDSTAGVIRHDDRLVVMRDKYPKGETHLLVLARGAEFADARGVAALEPRHAPLVRAMLAAGREAVADLKRNKNERAAAAAAEGAAAAADRTPRTQFLRLRVVVPPRVPREAFDAAASYARRLAGPPRRRHEDAQALGLVRDGVLRGRRGGVEGAGGGGGVGRRARARPGGGGGGASDGAAAVPQVRRRTARQRGEALRPRRPVPGEAAAGESVLL